ncbi:MAG: hypothetical protein IPL59_17100 [Candidatus Competibacteraceae bacterium]|nr:hypothetical protein [Candidatus Competibacteraceae bacterium]
MKNASKLAVLLAGALIAGNASAGVVTTLLQEDFENVKRVTTNPNTNGDPLNAATERTVLDILATTPSQLDHSGTSGYWVRNVPPASEGAFNVRAANNTIDGTGSTTAVLGDDEFDNFFDSQFLVIGDNNGNLGGDPNGIAGGLTQTLSFNFGLLSSFDSLNISFKYVFDANNPANPDDFSVSLTNGTDSAFYPV